MSLYQRKGTQNYQVDLRRSDGSRLRRSAGTTDLQEAQRVHARLLLEVSEPSVFENTIPTITTTEMVRLFLEHQGRLFPRSMPYFSIMCRHFLSRFKDRPLSSLTFEELAQFQAETRALRSATSANRLFQVIRRLLNLAVEWGRLRINPLGKLKRLKEPEATRRFLHHEEQERLLGSCGPNLRPLVFVALRTGMRRGELLRLRPSDVDFSRSLITVTGTKTDTTRQIPLLPLVRETLLGLADFDGDTRFFKSRTGLPWTPGGIDCTWRRLRKRALLPDVVFHDLRHTFASDCLAAGISEAVIQRLLGHASVETTQIYAKLTGRHVLGAGPILDAYIASQSGHSPRPRPSGPDELE